jgi:hypothetical protein
MSKRGIAVLIVVGALLVPLLGVAGYTAITGWLAPEPPDECDLLTIPEAQQILGGKVEIAERSAEPAALGDQSFAYACTYVSMGDGFDAGQLRVSLLSGYTRQTSSAVPGESKSLSGLGGRAWVLNGVATLRRDDMVVNVDFRRLGGESTVQDAPERALRKVAGRLSTVPDFPESEVFGVCDRLDVRAAERILGSELPVRRAAIRTNGEVRCYFTGAEARFEVKVVSNTDRVGGRRIGPGDLPVRGLSVKARADHYEPAHRIHFALGGQMYTIGLLTEGSAPPPQETDIPRGVLDTFEDCGDDLAEC